MDQIDPSEIPLRDIHLPEAISWWPLAPGWWFLLGIILSALVLAYLYFRKKRTSNREKIFASLDAIEQQFSTHKNQHELAKQLSVLARQIVVLEEDGNDDTKRGVIGPGWAQSWQDRLGSVSALSKDELQRALNIAPYRANEPIKGEQLIAAFRESLTTSPNAGPQQ